MPDPNSTELDKQVAVALFGESSCEGPLFKRGGQTFCYVCGEIDFEDIPLVKAHKFPVRYSTDPAAADRVMEWLTERCQDEKIWWWQLESPMERGRKFNCTIQDIQIDDPVVDVVGETWMEAVCLAALAVARAKRAKENGHGNA